MDIKKGKADMRTLKKTGIVLGMTVTMMTCVACGKDKASTEISNSTLSTTSATVQTTEVGHNGLLESKKKNIQGGFKISMPKDFRVFCERYGFFSINSNATQMVICNGYMPETEMKLSTTLEDCMKDNEETISNAMKAYSKLVFANGLNNYSITKQEKVTINGTEMLKVTGKDEKFGFVGYFAIVNSGTAMAEFIESEKINHQIYWFGFYVNDSDASLMEQYVDAMAQTMQLISE